MKYQEYLQSPEWKVKRELALHLSSGRCMICNSAGPLEIHHRSYARVGTPQEVLDLVALCALCHGIFHQDRHGVLAVLTTPESILGPSAAMQAANPEERKILDEDKAVIEQMEAAKAAGDTGLLTKLACKRVSIRKQLDEVRRGNCVKNN